MPPCPRPASALLVLWAIGPISTTITMWGQDGDRLGSSLAGIKWSGLIIDRGRGPELEGTRVTVYCVMDYVRAGDPPSQIAEELDLSEQQVQAALEYISAHRDEVEAQYEAILKRVSQPNPDWVEAGSAQTWDELRRRIAARSRGEPAHARHGR